MKASVVVLVCMVAVTSGLILDKRTTVLKISTGMPEPVPYPFANGSMFATRIINGVQAQKNAYPYQVGLELRVANGYTWCGGSLISNDYVLTATHCIIDAFDVTVLFGAHNRIYSYEAGQVRQKVGRSYFIVHSGYSSSTLENDVGLIKMPNKVTFTAQIQPIALPSRAVVNVPFEESPAIITGWGHTAGKAQIAQYLQYADVTIQTREECTVFFGHFNRPSNICVDGSQGKGSCYGDSGGPLVLTGGARYLIGVFSYLGFYGCEQNWPSVYTRVTSYLDWIAEHTGMQI